MNSDLPGHVVHFWTTIFQKLENASKVSAYETFWDLEPFRLPKKRPVYAMLGSLPTSPFLIEIPIRKVFRYV